MEKYEFGTASNHYFTALCEVAASRELDMTGLFTAAGIDTQLTALNNNRLPTEKLSDFQREIWIALDDEAMGILPHPLRSGTYYMMGKLTVTEPDLHKALALGARFYNLVCGTTLISLDCVGQQAMLRFHLPEPSRDHKHLFAEMCLLAWHRYASWLIADLLPLTEIHFPYASPAHAGEYHYLFPGEHKFSSSMLALVFPQSYLEKPVRQQSSSLKSFMQQCPRELFRQYKADYSLSTEIRRILFKSLGEDVSTIEMIAQQLHLTSRTLMRRLKDEGTSFQQVKDRVRRDKAIDLLSQPGMAINTVAELIGYSDPAVFTRAFKGWTGMSPRKFKQNLSKASS